MPFPAVDQLPSGIIRASFDPPRCVLLVQFDLPFSNNTETDKLRQALKPQDRGKKYGVFGLPPGQIDHIPVQKRIQITATPATKAFGFDTYDAAEDKYEQLAKTDAGKPSVKRGMAGLRQIGKAE